MSLIRVAAVVLFCSAWAGADDFTGRLGWGPRVGGDYPAGSHFIRHNGNADLAAGAWIRYGVNPRFSFGLTGEYASFGKNNPAIESLILDGFYHLLPDSPWNPNVHLGLGVANSNNNERQSSSALSTKLGFGVDRFVHPQIALGAHLDYQYVGEGTGASHAYPAHQVHAVIYGVSAGLWFGGYSR